MKRVLLFCDHIFCKRGIAPVALELVTHLVRVALHRRELRGQPRDVGRRGLVRDLGRPRALLGSKAGCGGLCGVGAFLVQCCVVLLELGVGLRVSRARLKRLRSSCCGTSTGAGR